MEPDFSKPESEPIRFGQRPPRRQVTDWSSRGMKRRLFLLVGGLMLVLVMMEQVRDPELWRKIGFTEQPAGMGQPKDAGQPGEWTEIRLVPEKEEVGGESARQDGQDLQDGEEETGDDRRGTDAARAGAADGSSNTVESEAALPQDDAHLEQLIRSGKHDEAVAWKLQQQDEEIRQTFWYPLLNRLEAEELKAIAARSVARERLPDELAAVLTATVEKLDVQVPRLSLEALDKLSREQVSDARTVAAEEMVSGPERWTETVRPWLLGDPASDKGNFPNPETTVGVFRLALDLVAWSRVVDRTGPARADEAAATILARPFLSVMSSGLMSYQPGMYRLMTEPQKYRFRQGGTFVWRGTLRGIEPVPSRPGVLDVDRIWALWVEPEEGGVVPLCVYSTEVPEGVVPNPNAFQSCELPVNFNGEFFKLRTYTDTNGKQAVCPLIFANSFWPVEQSDEVPAPLPDKGYAWNRIALWLIPLVLLAALTSWLVMRSLRKGRRFEPKGHREALRKLELDPSIMTARERVARLEKDRT